MHMIANTAYYYNQTIAQWPNKTVYIVRTNDLWHDMQTIDRMLCGTGDFQNWTGHQETHGSDRYASTTATTAMTSHGVNAGNATGDIAVNATRASEAKPATTNTATTTVTARSKDLSISQRQTLCCALVHELTSYRDIVMRAVNLSPIESEQTWNAALTDCGLAPSLWIDFETRCSTVYSMPATTMTFER
jgi:hypothetical protein